MNSYACRYRVVYVVPYINLVSEYHSNHDSRHSCQRKLTRLQCMAFRVCNRLVQMHTMYL